MAVRISFDSQVLLREGDILRLSPAERRDEKLGTFRVELCDGDTLYGTVRSDCSAAELRRCVILPRRSPNSFVAKSFNRLVEFLKVKSTQLSEPLRASLGLEETTIRQAIAPQAPEIFDASQQMAWSSAVDDDNRVVLIQGPPGTGKTRVIAAIVEELSRQNKRVLVSAPSHTAVDNICRRLRDVPVLRIGINVDRIAPDIAADYWEGELDNIRKFAARIRNGGQGGVWAGTPIGLLRSNIFWEEIKSNGQFDVVILDEAGMARVVDYLLLSEKSRRAILVGDHQQLPPFPLPQEVADELQRDYQAIPGYYWGMVKQSALEWMVEERGFPLLMLKFSYRCQNPRLLRFCSILFYDAAVKINPQADYYRLGYHERHSTFPPSTLRLYSTSALPERLRQEKVCFEGGRPGIENLLEAKLAVRIFYQTLSRYDSREVTIIAPYRRQVQLIRRLLSYDNAARYLDVLPEREEWEKMLLTQIATVDSFQGNESDVVITCYVRSNRRQGIGFVDDGNRINVAHTRCRREMVVIGDIEGLKQQERGNIFKRMERAIARDGEIIVLSEAQAEAVMNDDEVDLATAETITPAEEIAPPAPVPLSADTATEESPGDGSDREAKVQPTLFHL